LIFIDLLHHFTSACIVTISARKPSLFLIFSGPKMHVYPRVEAAAGFFCQGGLIYCSTNIAQAINTSSAPIYCTQPQQVKSIKAEN
jgi:hypothetical protein